MTRIFSSAVFALVLSACGDDDMLTREQLLDPETCRDCHPKHFEEWQSSMHAYAADDPLFLAMNKRGQRETDGELGDFCVQCHAPMALREGATTDGLNLDTVDQKLKGVTCYFCHTVKAVEGVHNNPLVLAKGKAMRGGIANALDNGVHATKYSALHDEDSVESSALCGACHDIETPRGLHLERTYAEWQESVFAIPPLELTCSNCHMDTVDDVIADFDGVVPRKRHSHSFPGVDTAIIDWPGKVEQREIILGELRTTVQSELCYNPVTNAMDLKLTNVGAGHMFPSGSAQDRRAWVELSVTIGGETVLESGVIGDDEAVDDSEDPLLWRMHDFAYNDAGEPEHMFWNIARIDSELLPPSITLDAGSPDFDHSRTRSYPLGNNPRPDRVDAIVHIRAVDLAVIDDLIASGDLDSKYRDAIETFDLEKSSITWTAETAGSDLCVR